MRHLTPRRRWLAISSLLFAGFLFVPLLLIMLLNGSGVNHVLTPVGSYIGMFRLIWPEHPFGALGFLLTKSFVVLAHHDPRSNLNLWTVEYDAVTVAVYLGVAILAGGLLSRSSAKPSLGIALTGLIMVAVTFTYVTILDHCSGPTWAGFVTIYGLGVDPLKTYSFWQWVFGAAGLGLSAFGLWRMRAG